MNDEALALWREWFERGGNPIAAEESGDYCCFFCGAYEPIWNGHISDCIYIRAKQLIHGPLFEGLKIEGLGQ